MILVLISRSKYDCIAILAIQGSKNISIKMLKNVGMIVPKSRETSAVYMQQDRSEVLVNNCENHYWLSDNIITLRTSHIFCRPYIA